MAKPESMKLNSSKLPQKIHPSNDPSEFNPLSYSLEKFRLYETRAVRFHFSVLLLLLLLLLKNPIRFFFLIDWIFGFAEVLSNRQ